MGERKMLTAGDMPVAAMQKHSLSEMLPGRGQAHADYLRGLASCIEARGVRARSLLEPYGLDPLTLGQSGKHLSCHTVVELLERSSRETNDSILGFRLAQSQAPDVLGCAIPLARAAPNFGSALDQLIRYLPHTHSREANLQLHVGRHFAELRWYSPVELEYCEQAYYHHLYIVYKMLATLAGAEFEAKRAALRCGVRAPDIETMSAAMGCRLQAKADGNLIAFDKELLDRPLSTANAVTFEILRTALETIVTLSSESLLERVRTYILTALPTARCTIDDCAAKLNTSSRTLQKRLTEHGKTFSEMVEATKLQAATQGLAVRSRPISEIALDLGYSEHSCFTRAFKRWTGQTPEEFRQRIISQGTAAILRN